jgi:hypothetical protein
MNEIIEDRKLPGCKKAKLRKINNKNLDDSSSPSKKRKMSTHQSALPKL